MSKAAFVESLFFPLVLLLLVGATLGQISTLIVVTGAGWVILKGFVVGALFAVSVRFTLWRVSKKMDRIWIKNGKLV